MTGSLNISPELVAELTAEATVQGLSLSDYLLLIIRERKGVMPVGASLRLSLLRALVGAVTPNLFAVTAGIVSSTIIIHAYFDGSVSEDDEVNISSIAAEVTADYPEDIAVQECCFSKLDTPLEMLDFWVFKREY